MQLTHLALAVLLAGCAASPPLDPPISELDREPASGPDTAAEPAQRPRAVAERIVRALEQRDWQTLASLAHPRGVRFSPYAFLDDSDVILEPHELARAFRNPARRTWGSHDGSGEPIELSFSDYYERFVYDVDFADAPEIAVNQVIGRGNTANNLAEVYPAATFVEFHFPGFEPRYEGMDWRSLRIVLLPHAGELRLAAVIHDQWTI